jgi:hypothetical protein
MMNLPSAAPISLRRQALMEELRLLDQSIMVGALPFNVNGPSLQDLLIEQANQSNVHEQKLIGRNRSGSGMGGYSLPREQLFQGVGGGHQQGGLKSLDQLSGAGSGGASTHSNPYKMALMEDRDAFVGLLKGKRSSILGSQSTPLTLQGCSFPLPSVKKARKTKGATLLSYRVLWTSNSYVRSPTAVRELFSRKVSQNRVEIVDNSTRLLISRSD